MRSLTTFTGRHGGSSAAPYAGWNLADHVGDDPATVEANRAELARRLGVSRDHLVFMQQVHGSDVAVVDGPGDTPVADALVTATPGVALAVLVADCVPILLVDDAAGVAAAVHAGRRGVALDVVGATLARMRELGATDVWAKIGPHIGPCCYEVGADVQEEVASVVPAARATTTRGTPSLDLRAAVLAQLTAGGVEHASAETACTAEDPGLYSYRRDGVTGRMAGVVLVRP